MIASPDRSEYSDFYAGYVGRVAGADVLSVLEDQIAETAELLGGLDEEAAGHRYAPAKWSVREVVGHMIDAERVFVYRATAFARADSAPLPGFDENSWVEGADFDNRTLQSLLDELGHLRRSTLAFFAGLEEAAWARRGTANGVELTVRAIAFIVAGHHAHHLSVLRERYLTGASPGG